VPGAAQTGPTAINNRRQIVGAYGDTTPLRHAFVWERGRFTTIDDEDADITSAFGINELGDIVGATAKVDATGNLTALHGFVRNPRGRMTTIDAPGAIGTAASAIHNRGQIVVSSDAVVPDCVSSATGPSASSTAARTRGPCAAGPATTAPPGRR
jgi:hypothetical protein